VGQFDALHMDVKTWMSAGRGLSEVEDELIEPATLSTDEKAALWLLAWSMLPPSEQLAGAEAHIELLSRQHAARQ
jgi:phage host-nuclease inhibitor protein Gam